MRNSIIHCFIIFHQLFCLGQSSKSEYSNIFDSQTAIVQGASLVSSQYQLSNWGYGASLYLGYGNLSEGLDNRFKNFMSYGLYFTFQYKRIAGINLGYSYSASRTKEDIPINGIIWNKDLRANFHCGELFLSSTLIDNETFKIAPLCGLALISINAHEPNNYDFNLEDNLLYDKVKFDKSAYTFGAIFDIKTTKNNKERHSYGAIRVRYTYYVPHFEKKYDGFTGSIHSIAIGIGGIFSGVKKKTVS